jgi:hypothetical protein
MERWKALGFNSPGNQSETNPAHRSGDNLNWSRTIEWRQQLRVALAQGPWLQILAVDLLVPAVERIEHGDAVGAGYFLTSFAATSVTALQVNSTKS